MKKAKEENIIVRPPTFPAKPMNGGRLEDAEPLQGDWWYKHKFNGKRVLFHTVTERTWNRQLEEVNYTRYPAFHKLSLFVGLRWKEFEWLDCEFLWGRHSIGKGALIVLDVVNEKPWGQRQIDLANVFTPETDLKFYQEPEKNGIYMAHHLHCNDPLKTWLEMQGINQEWGATFYEGLVAYKTDQPYPIQLFSPKRETRHWVKYRFID